QISPDVIVGITEVRVLHDGFVTFLNRIIEPSHEAVGPSEEGVGFGSGVSLNRLLVECNGLLQLTLHLPLVGLLKELPCLAFVFFTAFALEEEILNVHSDQADEKGPQRRSQLCELLNVPERDCLRVRTPCGLAG